jgi:hypothetical protein
MAAGKMPLDSGMNRAICAVMAEAPATILAGEIMAVV